MFVDKGVFIGLIIFLLTGKEIVGEWHDEAGPWVIATKGEPWPLPANRKLYKETYRLDPTSFKFQIRQESCMILEEAVKRYKRIIFNDSNMIEVNQQYLNTFNDDSEVFGENLTGLDIRLKNTCEVRPRLSSNESYILNVLAINDNKTASLTAESIWGILRGLETFSQLVVRSDNGKLTIRAQKIIDYPRFPHRGLLIDTSRHYLPVSDILLTLDAMSYNKLNVLHWHIVDDNSFPYESKVFPELSAKGAYHPTMIYSADDVQKIIDYARMRGIRVLPEFDTPGHTKSWGLSYPLLTMCYDGNGPTGKLGPINPTSDFVYNFMKNLLGEVTERFTDEYVHLGGDEVPYDCWKSNPSISDFMRRNNITQKYQKLEEYYIQRILDIMSNLKAKPIVWQEVFDNGVKMHEGTVVQVWTGNWRNEMAAVTSAGHPALLSACWYLDHVASGGGDWIKYYKCDPLDFRSNYPEQWKLVLGGEACMWGEFVDRNNVHPRIWPRASAAAERLWSIESQDEDEAAQRLEEHACRMNRRGIPAQPPNGSGFCLV